MNRMKLTVFLTAAVAVTLVLSSDVSAQRRGNVYPNLVMRHYLIANGPAGPIQGGESAITGMILLDDGWVYGSTEASWGGKRCHIFKTDGETSQHVLTLTDKLPGQPKIRDMAHGPASTLICVTSTYNEIFDENPDSYEGGHIFSFDPETSAFVDHGIVQNGQGLNCVAVDTTRTRVFCVTYPAGHLFSYNYTTKEKMDFGCVMKPWRVEDKGRVSWRGVPKVLMIDDTGTAYYSTYVNKNGGRIYRLVPGDETPVFTGAIIPTQQGMDDDPLYENGIASAIRADDGGFWCGTINDGFLFKFLPSTSTVINKGKPFQYWNLRSLAYGGDGDLYMLGGRDFDNSWLLRYSPGRGSIDCLGWPTHTTQMGVICADAKGRILMGENLRSSYIWVYTESGRLMIDEGALYVKPSAGGEVREP